MENNVVKLLDQRYAGRSISSKGLAKEVVDNLIEAARLTPSCFNKQPWRFLFLESDNALAKGREILASGNRDRADTAPLLVIGYAGREDDCRLPDGRDYYQFDLGMAVMNLMLAATEHGLAARPMAGFSTKKAAEVFNIDKAFDVLIVIAIGSISPDESHLPDHLKGKEDTPRERKEPEKIVTRL